MKSICRWAAFIIVALFVMFNPWLIVIIGICAAISYFRSDSDNKTYTDDLFAKKEPYNVEAREVEDKR